MTRGSALKQPITAGVWLTLVAPILGAALPAKAETDIDQELPEAVDLAVTAPERESASHWTLGLGAAAVPEFQGSDDYEIMPIPLVDVRYGRFFVGIGNGVGFNVLETPTFTVGASVNWMQGYDRNDVPAGIDEVDGALGASLLLSARAGGAVATFTATQAVTETDRGLVLEAGLGYPMRVTERLTLVPSLGATWANEKYMDSYFGINASEAAASGLSLYEPTNGFKDVTFGINVNYRITDSISAMGSAGVTYLLDKAADSPIVEKRTQPIGLIGLTYTF